MYYRLLSFITCFLLFIQCENDKKYTLSRSQLAIILVDLHVAEGATSLLDGAKKDSVTKLYYQQTFEIQRVKEADFQKNLELLKLDAEEMAKVYKIVIDTLESRNKRVLQQ